MSFDSSETVQFLDRDCTLYQEEYVSLTPFAAKPNALVYAAKDRMGEEFFITEYAPQDSFLRNGNRVTAAEGHEQAFEDGLKLFIGYSKLLSQLAHTNIERIVQRFEENGTAYIVTAAGKQSSVADQIADDSFFFQPDEVERASQQLVEIGQYLNSFGIRGFDLSPKAIVIDDETSAPMFLLRHYLDGTCQVDETAENRQEQAVFSLAQTLYQLVSLRRPSEPYRPLVGNNEDFGDHFLQPIDDCLQQKTQFSGFDAFGSALRGQTASGSSKSQASSASPGKKSKALPLSLAMVALLGGGGYFAYSNGMLESVIPAASTPQEVAAKPQSVEPKIEIEKDVVAASEPVKEPEPKPLDTTKVIAAEPQIDGQVAETSEPQEAVVPTVVPKKANDDNQVVLRLVEAGEDKAPEVKPEKTISQKDVTDIFKDLNQKPIVTDQNPPEPAVVAEETVEDASAEKAEAAPIAVGKTEWTVSLPFDYELRNSKDGQQQLAIKSASLSPTFAQNNSWYRSGFSISKVLGQPVDAETDLEALLRTHFAKESPSAPTISIEYYDPVFDAFGDADLVVNAEAVVTIGKVKLRQLQRDGNWSVDVLAVNDPLSPLKGGDTILGEQTRQASIEKIDDLVANLNALTTSGAESVLLFVRKANGQSDQPSISISTFR